jgi:hypothetical protein
MPLPGTADVDEDYDDLQDLHTAEQPLAWTTEDDDVLEAHLKDNKWRVNYAAVAGMTQ